MTSPTDHSRRQAYQPSTAPAASPANRRLGFFAKVPPLLLAVTIGRLLLIPIIVLSFDRAPALTIAALIVFIAVDLYDGVLARQLSADDPPRRVLDTLIDRLSIWPVYLAVTIAGFLPAALLVLLLMRDAYCGYLCYRMVRAKGIAIRADWMYRSLNLALAGWVALAPFLEARWRDALFLGILTFSVSVAIDLKRSVAMVMRMSESVHSAVIPAGALRSQRARVTTSAGQIASTGQIAPDRLDPVRL